MSDLAATNCGCNCGDNGCNSIIWIILLLCCCGNGRNGSFLNNDGCGCNGGSNNCIWIIILLLCCGGFGGYNGCGGNSFC